MTVPNTPEPNVELLRVLTNSVRILTAEQAMIVAGEFDIERAKNRFRRLQAKGLLKLTTAWICPPALTATPLVSWEPQTPPPDFSALARNANRRWSAEQIPQLVAVATAQARNLYSSVKSREPRESELAHDVWVADLFIRRFFHEPIYLWVHEDGFVDLFPEGNRPDAALVESAGNEKPIAIELLGRYRSEKIEQFHNYCQEYGFSYEIW